MINSNIDFLGNPKREINSKVEIYEASTLLHTIYNTDEIIDFTIDRQGQSKFFGFGVCQKLNLHTLNRNANIVYDTSKSLKVYLQDYSFYPTFYITEKHLDETNGKLSITAYDALYAAGNHTISEAFESGIRNKTQQAVATGIANFLGLAGVEYKNINDELLSIGMVNNSTFGDISLRKALDIIAESLAASYYINNQNKLVFSCFAKKTPVAEITKEDYIDFTTGDNKRLTKIERVNELEDSEFVETSLNGTTQFIRENPYLENRADAIDVLYMMLDSVGNATLTQYELLWRGNPNIEVFDKVKIEDKDGVQQEIVIYNDTITYNGGLTQKSSWKYEDTEDESGNNPATLGEAIKQTYAKVDKVNREIELVVSDVEDALDTVDEVEGKVAQLKIDVNGISTTVRDVENTVNGYSSRIGSLEVSVNGINATVSDINDTVDGYEARIGKVEATANEVTLSVERIDGEIDDLEGVVEQNQKDIAAINVTAESITSSVESVRGIAEDAAADVSTLRDDMVAANDETNATIETLESKITQTARDLKIEFNATIGDIDSVTTSTGFTFDADGLKVEKSGSEMSTQITEDGMKVYRNDEEMLTANNQGVNAVNLHATTYLIVGYNSRFEDMGNRTGCFWIGG